MEGHSTKSQKNWQKDEHSKRKINIRKLRRLQKKQVVEEEALEGNWKKELFGGKSLRRKT